MKSLARRYKLTAAGTGAALALGLALAGPAAAADPVLDPIGDKSIAENSTLTIVANASDADLDPLTYSASNLPSGATFTPATKTFSWKPAFTQEGDYPAVHFEVSDGNGTDFEDITIHVTHTNAPPVFTTPTTLVVGAEGTLMSFTLAATDVDGDLITYGADTSTFPPGAAFDSGTNTFNWTPGYTDEGFYPGSHFTASDGTATTVIEPVLDIENTTQATTTSLSISKLRHRIKGSGKVMPAPDNGDDVKLKLQRRKHGKFHTIASATAHLKSGGKYSAKLKRARKHRGTCQVVAKYVGSFDFDASTTTKSVGC